MHQLLSSRNLFQGGYIRLLYIFAGILLTVTAIINLFFQLPDYLSNILSMIWFLYVPATIGNELLQFLAHKIRDLGVIIKPLSIPGLFVKWSTGFLITVLIIILPGIYVKSPHVLSIALLIIPTILYCAHRSTQKFENFDGKTLFIPICVLVIGLAFGLYVRSYSPYPLTPGYDIFSHMYVIKSFLDNSISNSPLVYFSTFDMILGLSVVPFGSTIQGIFWSGPVLLFMIFAVGIFSLSKQIFGNLIHSLLSTIIALSVTEMGLVSNLQFMYPSSFVMAVFPLALFASTQVWLNQIQFRTKMLVFFIICSLLVMVHLQLGFVAIIFIVLYLGLLNLAKKADISLYCIRIAAISLFMINTFLYFGGYANYFLHLRAFDSEYLYSLSTKIKHLNWWYTEFMIVISLAGLFLSSISKRSEIVISGLLASLFLFIYFQQIDTIHRIMTLERPMLSMSAAFTISLILFSISRLSFTNKFFYYMKNIANIPSKIRIMSNQFTIGWINFQPSMIKNNNRLTVILFLITIIILVPLLVIPYDTYIQPYTSAGFSFSNFSTEDIETGKWIEKNTNKNLQIFSDPWTVLEFRGLSYRKNIEAIGWNQTVMNLVSGLLESKDAKGAHQDIIKNFGKNILLVITPKTSKWLKGLSVFSIQLPSNNIESFSGIEKFFDIKYFTQLYHSKSAYVFVPN